MRIICPNCLAEYEVHASAVPPPGRDVQCSNCGHGWFQPAAAGFEEAGKPEPDDAPSAEADPEEAARRDREARAPDTDPDLHSDPDPEPDPEHPTAPDDGPEPGAEQATAEVTPRRRIDDDVLGVLREEAEREMRARRAEALEMEAEGDLGLDAAGPHGGARPRRPVLPGDGSATPRPVRRPAQGARARVSVVPAAAADALDAALPEDEQAPPPPAPAPAPSETRRHRLPDIEEVTGSLNRPGEAAVTADETPPAPGAGGFRLGFLVVLLMAALTLVVYALAPHIGAAVPALEPALAAFARGVDAARLWVALRIDAVVQAVAARGA